MTKQKKISRVSFKQKKVSRNHVLINNKETLRPQCMVDFISRRMDTLEST